jgi:hypothetical protein
MSFRYFVDSGGIDWMVYSVSPWAVERREEERRRTRESEQDAEREAERGASGLDRRVSLLRRHWLPALVRDGWLSFESEGEHRRLSPIPAGWELLDASGLEALRDQAMRVEAKSRAQAPAQVTVPLPPRGVPEPRG